LPRGVGDKRTGAGCDARNFSEILRDHEHKVELPFADAASASLGPGCDVDAGLLLEPVDQHWRMFPPDDGNLNLLRSPLLVGDALSRNPIKMGPTMAPMTTE
jgi:hypothetical protein